MNATFLQQSTYWYERMQDGGSSDNLVAVTVWRSKVLALTDVKNSSACKHHCSSSNTFRHERAISECMQAILLGASSKGLNCRRGKNERAAVFAAKDQWLMMFDKMHGDVQAKLVH